MKYLKEIINKNKILVFIYILTGVLIAFLKNFSADYFRLLIDKFNNKTLTSGTIVIYGLALIIICILSYLDEYPGRKLEHGIFLDLKLKALKKISKIDYIAYQTMGTGKLIQRVENGAAAGKSILFDFYFSLIRELAPSIIFSMVFISRISKTIMYLILAGYLVVFIVTNLLLRVLYKIKNKILVNEEKLNHYLVRGFMEMLVFRINVRFDSEIKKTVKSRNEIVDSKVKMKLVHEAFFMIFALLVTFIKIGIIAYGWITKSITIGSAVALISLVENAYTPVAIFNVLFVQYKLDKMAFNRFENFLNSNDDTHLEHGIEIKKALGDIKVEKITFSYGDRVIFNNLNLNISHGENIAFVGESGSGKSTLVKLLLGLLKPDSGNILIDNINLSDVCLNSFYRHVSYISQEPPVFNGTLRENLVFDEEVDDKKILEVLEKVNLSGLYKKLDKGLDTFIGEKGTALSGGERQRLALARLWFKSCDIIILDEATSAMDNLTEECVMRQVLTLLSGKTVIAIAHRINSVKNFDRIYTFKDGKIIGQGTFDKLILTSSYFNELYNAAVNE